MNKYIYAILITCLSQSFIFCEKLVSQTEMLIVDEKMRRHEFVTTDIKITPGLKIIKHQAEIDRMELDGKSKDEINAAMGIKQLQKFDAAGTISGRISYNGGNPPVDIKLALYDQSGDFVSDESNYFSGRYKFYNVPEGLYYVVMKPMDGHGFVREYYNNAVDWQDATLVQVINDSQVENIDFDLDLGAKFSGYVYEEDGITPLGNSNLEIRLYDADYKWYEQLRFDYRHFVDDCYEIVNVKSDSVGYYEMGGIRPGRYKLSLTASGHGLKYYNNEGNWLNATVLVIEDSSDHFENINFSLPLASKFVLIPVDEDGNTISFTTHGNMNTGITPVDSVGGHVFAVNSTFFPTPMISAKVSPGSYTIFMSVASYGYCFYDNVTSVFDATPVEIASGETKTIYFKVPYRGGDRALAVSIYDKNGDLVNDFREIMLYSCDYGKLLNVSYLMKNARKASPPYSFTGYPIQYGESGNHFSLSYGDYLLCAYRPNAHEEDTTVYAHKFLGDVHSIKEAVSVELFGGDTTWVEMHLSGGGISGWVWAIGESQAVAKATVKIINAETNEVIGLEETDENGYYCIQNLSGKFKVLALANDDDVLHADTYFGGVCDCDNAEVIEVSDNGIVEHVDIALNNAGQIYGKINVPNGDTSVLPAALAVVYDAQTGEFINWDMIGFNQSFCFKHLPPGEYYVAAFYRNPYVDYDECTVTYYGGGTTFDSASNQKVVLTGRIQKEIEIDIIPSDKKIYGQVFDNDLGLPAQSGVGVGAFFWIRNEYQQYLDRMIMYDQTGHITAMGSIVDGHYDLRGFHPGSYYLRTDIRSWAYRDKWFDGTPVSITLEDALEDFNYRLRPGFIWGTPFYFTTTVSQLETPLVVSDEPVQVDFNLSKTGATVVDKQVDVFPTSWLISQNYPNPFNPETTIEYNLPKSSHVVLTVFDILGHEIITLVDEKQQAGLHQQNWNACDCFGNQVSSGIYVYKIKTDDDVCSKKMLYIK